MSLRISLCTWGQQPFRLDHSRGEANGFLLERLNFWFSTLFLDWFKSELKSSRDERSVLSIFVCRTQ